MIMAQKKITDDIQAIVKMIVANFNQTYLPKSIKYIPRFKGANLYLDRSEHGRPASAICRLTFTGDIDTWSFAIYKYGCNQYDPNEIFLPGIDLLDGSIEGAMRCGMKAYPA